MQLKRQPVLGDQPDVPLRNKDPGGDAGRGYAGWLSRPWEGGGENVSNCHLSSPTDNLSAFSCSFHELPWPQAPDIALPDLPHACGLNHTTLHLISDCPGLLLKSSRVYSTPQPDFRFLWARRSHGLLQSFNTLQALGRFLKS